MPAQFVGRLSDNATRLRVLAFVAVASAGLSAFAQPSASAISPYPSLSTVSFGPATVARYRIGAKIVAAAAAVSNAKIIMAVPLECPEQRVKRLNEDVTPGVAGIADRQVDEGVRQIVINIRRLAAGEEAHAYVTYEVATTTLLSPEHTETLQIPHRPTASLRRYLKPSPMIDVGKPAIHAAVDAALKSVEVGRNDDAGHGGAEANSPWSRVAALYDYAQRHIAYELSDDKSPTQALADGRGDCQAIAATFVAMCRTYGVPARMVWVDGHQYAEFYLESARGKGSWYPVESAGSRSFGAMPLARVILQKGDAIRVPEQRGKLLRYASDFAVFPTQPAEAPTITFVRERVDAAGQPLPSSALPAAGSGAGAGSASAASSAVERP